MTETVMPQSLAASHRRVHRSLIEAVLATGAIPTVEELVAQLETSEDALRDSLNALSAADYLALDTSGEVSCLYPFSATPTPHVVLIDRQPRYAMCAIDALGTPAMLDRELDISARCAVCNAPIALKVAPGAVRSAEPATALVVARRDEAEPAFAACCPFTVFVCGTPHAEQFMRRIPDTPALPILYTQAGCAESAQVRTWLTEHDIHFRERDASADAEAATALAATGIFATPLLVVGETTVLGFRPQALAAALGTHDP